jgi:hypothetical protein
MSDGVPGTPGSALPDSAASPTQLSLANVAGAETPIMHPLPA